MNQVLMLKLTRCGCVKTAKMAIGADMGIWWIPRLCSCSIIYIKQKLVFIGVDVICKHL